MRPKSDQKKWNEAGFAIAYAIQAVSELPESPARENVLLDLTTAQEWVRAMKQASKDAGGEK